MSQGDSALAWPPRQRWGGWLPCALAVAVHAWLLWPTTHDAPMGGGDRTLRMQLVVRPVVQTPAPVTTALPDDEAARPTNLVPNTRITETPPQVAEGEGTASGADVYLPRSALTLAPRPLSTVQIEYPEGAPWQGGRGRAVVFVNERGEVQRIQMSGGNLSPIFEQAVREAFISVRFQPGEKDGRPVKAQFPFEVEFATEPAADGT